MIDRSNENDLSLERLRKDKHALRKPLFMLPHKHWGQYVSDRLTALVGSWAFIIVQACLLIAWMIINSLAWFYAWDPYPFILLNLVLSFQAAFTAPIIMMSQNRQNAIDRHKAENDYHINIKAELEIELLHQKIDLLKEKEIKELIDIIRNLETLLQQQNSLKPGN